MGARSLGFAADLDKVRFLTKSNQQKAATLGTFVEDDFENTSDIDAALSSNYEYDATDLVIRQVGAPMATLVSKAWTFAQNVPSPVTGIWEAEGAVRVFFSRDNGATWKQLTNGVATTITGAIGKNAKLKAELDPGAVLKGWSAHW